jgi:hypothetical protein
LAAFLEKATVFFIRNYKHSVLKISWIFSDPGGRWGACSWSFLALENNPNRPSHVSV